MDEYIKKSEAVDVIVKYPYNISGKTATAIKMIEDLPSADVVEVVRCKDCKYLSSEYIGDDLEWICKLSDGMVNPAPDKYCSYGERRE